MNSLAIYRKLLSHYGSQGWWPASGGFRPREWEICVGAILTQNTSWNNVEKALLNLRKNNCVSVKGMIDVDTRRLENMIKPSGFFRQKADRLKILASFVNSFSKSGDKIAGRHSGSFEDFRRNVTREGLLGVKGIGPETADSILLYACGRPYFVVDAYTRRIFHRLGLLEHNLDYEKTRNFFESSLPKDANLYNEFHALIVNLGKDTCRKKPLCSQCPLERVCRKRGV
ncbi:MAG: endonuclease III domain-containing protein [Candidatus Aenigmarchaeota archaeon]|nr:endonuclease III domain-containing protein [Candidatus Aenigmarchaeota archaeon]